MPSDRDKSKSRTPPIGTKLVPTPPPIPREDSWEEPTGVTERPVNAQESLIEKVVRRTGETKNTTLDIAIKVDNLEKRVDSAHTILEKSVLPALTEQGKQNTQIIGLLTNERNRSGQIKTETELSQVRVTETEQLADHEMRKARELSQIKQEEADSDARREVYKKLALQVIAGLSIAAAAILALMQTRQC